MRRGVWVVLGLVGWAPVGALAQQDRQPSVTGQASSGQASSGQASSAPPAGSGQAGVVAPGAGEGLIIVEMPASGERRASDVGPARRPSIRPDSATGGSGSPGLASQSRPPVEQEVFVGTVRSLEGGRLLMQGPSRRVYEFDLSDQTRLIGQDGVALPLQPLPEGTPVVTLTQEGEVRNRVLTLQILGEPQTPAP